MEKVISEQIGRVAKLALNRPAKANCLTEALMAALQEALQSLEEDDSVSVVVITGNEHYFCAGADLEEMIGRRFGGSHRVDCLSDAWEAIFRFSKPLIAAVQGYAVGGGCELVTGCDVVIAGESAQFGQPEISVGTLPGLGGTQRLPRLIGRSRAMDWCLTGRLVSAQEAHTAGLVTQVLPDKAVLPAAMTYARQMSMFSLPVLKMIKASIKNVDEYPLSAGLVRERQWFYASFDLHDRHEGMSAFVEKRTPRFEHR
ncbi:enoyl-CoA hydratase-related protein [Dyella sp.]|jgi:enoyl-CoA hydratase/carnithine racemase|uniref:enoyl-CoA hydratase-related protein n=1 Tax=Dyella sp. TaxID=1869338 RepID=UPI002FD92026